MNVKVNSTKKIKMNITHNLQSLSNLMYKRVVKQSKSSLKQQLSGQASLFRITPKCEQRLAYASGG